MFAIHLNSVLVFSHTDNRPFHRINGDKKPEYHFGGTHFAQDTTLKFYCQLHFAKDLSEDMIKRIHAELMTHYFILAGGHVRASAGALAVHTALIPCVCLCVRYQTPFSSRHESGPSWFLSTGKHPVGGQLPRVFFSALPGQSSDRPNLPPHKKLSIFQFPFASIRRAPSEVCSGLGKRRIDHSTSKRSTKKLQRAAITAFFLDRSLVVVHCDRSWPVDDCHESENNACA